MATAEDPPPEVTEDRIYLPGDEICALCDHTYRDPRLLHCGRAACYKCLLEFSQGRASCDMECPRCSEKITLSVRDVHDLKKAINIQRTVEDTIMEQLQEGTILCDTPKCRRAERKAVTCCDHKACGLICEDCLNEHRNTEIMKLHILTPLSELLERGWIEISSPPYCNEPGHGDIYVDRYCKTHRKMICVDCTSDEGVHQECKHHRIQSKAKIVKEGLTELVNKIDRYTTCLDNIIRDTNKESDQAKQAISEMEREINITADKLHTKTDEDKNQGLEEFAGDKKKIEDEAREAHTKVDERKNKLLEENAGKQKKPEDDTRSAHIKIDEDKKQLLEQLAGLKKQLEANMQSVQNKQVQKVEHTKKAIVRVLEDTEEWRVVEADKEKDRQKQYTTIANTIIPIMSLERITPISDKSPTARSDPDKTPGSSTAGGSHDNCVGELSVEPRDVQSGRYKATPVRDINLEHNTMVTGIVSLESHILVTHVKYDKIDVYEISNKHVKQIAVPEMKHPNSMVRLYNMDKNAKTGYDNIDIIIGDFDGKLLHLLTFSSAHMSIQNHQKVKLKYQPHNVSVDADTDTIIVTDRKNKGIYIYNREGTQQHVITLHCYDTWPRPRSLKDIVFEVYGLQGPVNIADPVSCVHVSTGFVAADAEKNKVFWYNYNGDLTKAYGQGSDHPRHVALTGCGNILVVDCRNHRVQLLNQTGHFLRHVLEEGDGMRYPSRVHVDATAGKLYVGYWPEDDDKSAIKVVNFTEIPTKHTTLKVKLSLADI